jgi:hypothetical protein
VWILKRVTLIKPHIRKVKGGRKRLIRAYTKIVNFTPPKPKKVKDYIKGGKADNVPASQFLESQIKKGMKVEREHTTDPKIAREIAKDHLIENPHYYDYLNKMEKKMDRDLKNFGFVMRNHKNNKKESIIIYPAHMLDDYDKDNKDKKKKKKDLFNFGMGVYAIQSRDKDKPEKIIETVLMKVPGEKNKVMERTLGYKGMMKDAYSGEETPLFAILKDKKRPLLPSERKNTRALFEAEKDIAYLEDYDKLNKKIRVQGKYELGEIAKSNKNIITGNFDDKRPAYYEDEQKRLVKKAKRDKEDADKYIKSFVE